MWQNVVVVVVKSEWKILTKMEERRMDTSSTIHAEKKREYLDFIFNQISLNPSPFQYIFISPSSSPLSPSTPHPPRLCYSLPRLAHLFIRSGGGCWPNGFEEDHCGWRVRMRGKGVGRGGGGPPNRTRKEKTGGWPKSFWKDFLKKSGVLIER